MSKRKIRIGIDCEWCSECFPTKHFHQKADKIRARLGREFNIECTARLYGLDKIKPTDMEIIKDYSTFKGVRSKSSLVDFIEEHWKSGPVTKFLPVHDNVFNRIFTLCTIGKFDKAVSMDHMDNTIIKLEHAMGVLILLNESKI